MANVSVTTKLILMVVVFIVILHLIPPSHYSDPAFHLESDGAQLFKSAIPSETVHRWKTMCQNREYKELKAEMHSDKNLQKIIHSISAKHQFQDYIWIIEKSAVHTCHRDNNGTFFNVGQKHPSYTMIVYLDQGMGQEKCLGVIPRSHKSKYANMVNVFDQVRDIQCSTGDVIVFNANLIHVGTITARDDNLRVQMKISHPDDLDTLGYYQNFNKVLNKENQNSKMVRQIQRHVSCSVPFVSDLTQTENIRASQGTAGGAEISDGQKWFSYLFYGRTDFYDLPNAW